MAAKSRETKILRVAGARSQRGEDFTGREAIHSQSLLERSAENWSTLALEKPQEVRKKKIHIG